MSITQKRSSGLSVKFENDLPKCDAPALKCRLSSVGDIVKVLSLLPSDSWVYRGQYDAKWRLQTSLERKYGANSVSSKQEMRAMVNFRNQARMCLNLGDSFVDTLAAMQHYGVPTRMLDFTRSFFIAMYFAFAGNDTKQPPHDHAIWAVNLDKVFPRSKVFCNERDRRVADEIGDVGAKGDLEFLEAYADWVEEELQRDSIARAEMICKTGEAVLRGESEDKGAGILPIDISGRNSRMFAQNGLFIMTTDFSSFENSLSSALHLQGLASMPSVRLRELKSAMKIDGLVLVKFILSEKLHCKALDLLKAANIGSQTLFPDLSGIAAQITY